MPGTAKVANLKPGEMVQFDTLIRNRGVRTLEEYFYRTPRWPGSFHYARGIYHRAYLNEISTSGLDDVPEIQSA